MFPLYHISLTAKVSFLSSENMKWGPTTMSKKWNFSIKSEFVAAAEGEFCPNSLNVHRLLLPRNNYKDALCNNL